MSDFSLELAAELRRQAEARLTQIVTQCLPRLDRKEIARLVQALSVYQVELEVQREEIQLAQAEAERGRDRYRELYESVPIGYFTLDAAWRISFLNPAGASLLGLRSTSVSSKHFNSFLSEQDADRFKLLCGDVVATQESKIAEFTVSRPDGTAFTAMLQAAPVRASGDTDDVLRITFDDITTQKEIERNRHDHEVELVTARDVAELHLAEALHRESQAARQLLISNLRLNSILQSAMDAILTVDENQQVLLFNEAAERLFQCPAKEAIGQSLDRFIPARFRAAHREHVRKFGRSGVTSRQMGELGMVTGLRRDGSEFPVEAAISHITVEGKRFYTVILRDVTERERAERLVRQSEERYRRLISVLPLGLFVTRGDRVIFANDAGLRLFGAVKAEEILGRFLLSLFHLDYGDIRLERMHELLEGRSPIPTIEKKIVSLDGMLVDVEVSAARLADEEGPAILVMLRDVSERKRLQDQLRKTERIAELGTVASGMAHEIGTPMNVILGRAEYLMDRVADEQVKKGLQTIITQVERITKVMNQLLSFARRKTPHRRAVDLREVIEDGMEMFKERFSRNQIRVELALANSCPMALADLDQMSQVFINLVMNAVHAMPNGGTLRVGLAPEKQVVKLTIADTGHGIPPEVIKKIYEPFFTTKEFGKGTGLGLTVVKGIIEEHQGFIDVESEEGKGTVFTILLPRAE